jgi:hypothetical protein
VSSCGTEVLLVGGIISSHIGTWASMVQALTLSRNELTAVYSADSQ